MPEGRRNERVLGRTGDIGKKGHRAGAGEYRRLLRMISELEWPTFS